MFFLINTDNVQRIYEDGQKSSKDKMSFLINMDKVQRNLRGWAQKF